MLVPLGMGAILVRLNLPGFELTDRLLSHGFSRRGWELGAIVLGAAVMVVVGAVDDRYELGAGAKFCGQLVAAALAAIGGARITLFVHNEFFSYAVTMLWILTVTNAFNFMDNMNGLCAGLGAIAAWCFACIAAVDGQYLVALLGLVMCGALLGFLPHNFPKASAFLGDAGSHLVGYLLAVMAILPHFFNRQDPRQWAVLLPLMVLAVPLGDLAWVVLIRVRLKKPVYVGDTNHLSHRLVRRGMSRERAVVLIWLLAVVLGSIAILIVLR